MQDLTPRATYRLQLGSALTLADARGLVPYLHELGVSHLYLSPVLQARRGSTHGYDVVDPRRVSEELGGKASCARSARRARAGMGSVLDIVPNHMAAGDENLFWRDPELRERFFDVDAAPACTGASSTSTSSAAYASRSPRCSRRRTAKCSSSSRDGARRRPAHRPSRRARRPARLPRAARARGRRARLGREDPRAGRAAARLAGRGDDGLRVPQRRAGALRRPGRRGDADRARRGAGERLRRGRGRGEARAGARRRSSPSSSGCARLLDVPGPRRARSPRCRSTARTSSRASGRVEDGRPRGGRRRCRSELRRVLLLEERGHDEFVTRFQQTTGPVMAKGVEDTAFYRYVRLLALNEVGGDPGRFGRCRRGSSIARTCNAPSASRWTLLARDDARHEAQRRRARAHRRARGHRRALARRVCAGTS